MRLVFTGDTGRILKGASILAEDLGFEAGTDGYEIHVIQRPGGIDLEIHKNRADIFYEKPCHFYRALMLLAREFRFHNGQNGHICETPRINRTGLMLDVSRNAVLTVDSIKHFLKKISLMGMDILMLYIEDIYFLNGYSHFGYMRGRYTDNELKEIDDYASMLGIEIIPYIQTLAHMGQILRWDDMEQYRDTGEIILAGEEKTYLFLDQMIGAVSSHFRSRRINIGMDEAHELGLGRYLALNGYRNRMQIMREHLNRVLGITEKYGLTAMIASDMLFHNEGAAADHYELGDTTACPIELPDNLDLMYWDYYNTDIGKIRAFIRRHKDWGKTPTYLGTVRTWESYAAGFSQSFTNSKAALDACALENVTEAVVSVWLNDGAENSLFAALPGISYFAQQVYSSACTDTDFIDCFQVQTGAGLDAFLTLGAMDEIAAKDGRSSGGNPSKFLLWQDPLLGFFDYHIRELEANKHYLQLEKRMEECLCKMGPYTPLMETMRRVCRVLSRKAEIGIKIKNAYDSENRAELAYIANSELPAIGEDVEKLRSAHRDLWMTTLKPFGWEVLDIRYGGLGARLDTAAQRIAGYVNGNISCLPELEEQKIPYTAESQTLPLVLTYDRIISAGYQNGPVR
jgi:hypothetical protein